jgi:hypothetical protein
MDAMMKLLLGGLLFLLLGHAVPGYAGDDRLRFEQATSGAITVILFGTVNPCAGSNIFPMGPASVIQAGNEFDIASGFAILDPLPCPSPAQPYQVAAPIGIVPDGQYAVVWTVGPIVARGSFAVASGAAQFPADPVPTLDLPALLALLTFVGVGGMIARRWRSRR